jgi:hypothetical protein
MKVRIVGVRHVKKTVVYYETIKRELKIKPIPECRCDERLILFETIKRELKIKPIPECRCDERLINPVYVRRVDSSALIFSLSSHRHSLIGLVFKSYFIDS